MNRDRLEGGWKQLSGRLKEHWGRLANEPLREFAGRRDQISGRAQERYGRSKEEAARQLREFIRRNRHWSLLNR